MGRLQTEETKEKIKNSLRLKFNTLNKELPCLICGKLLSSRKRKTQYCIDCLRKQPKSLDTKKKLSDAAIKNNFGGNTSKIRIWYKKKNGSEIWLQSSYELKFAELLDELNLEWSRPKPFIWIDENNKQHRYYPDFKVNNTYYDTKNDYLAIKDKNKIDCVIQQNNINLIIVKYNEINKDFILATCQLEHLKWFEPISSITQRDCSTSESSIKKGSQSF